MKYILSFIFIVIIISITYKYIIAADEPIAYKKLLEKQNNYFVVQKDSAAIMWTRAKMYLNKNAALICGGPLQQSDTLLYIPYYNDHKKGNAIRIEQHVNGDSVSFNIQWWYSQKLQINGSRAIALYMRYKVEKSNFE
ncbi:hypothetical protein ACFOWM_07205 [Ferruginibacter yonginensis]|uniref:Uncharacterized protein n=1 Tax=Ferruginibacter yonginensis TaxID=1310416 RepID=A0ABV8QSC9_9BACT